MQKFDNKIVLLRKTPIFSPKLSKIAENCDLDIDNRYFGLKNSWQLRDGQPEPQQKSRHIGQRKYSFNTYYFENSLTTKK
jgi:hypothetical protein